MDCQYDIKQYDAVILQMVDLDRLKIVYPITTANAVIITDFEDYPITLTNYLRNLKQYTEDYTPVYLWNLESEELPDGKAYRATDGKILLDIVNNLSLEWSNSFKINQEEYSALISDVNNVKDRVQNLEQEILQLQTDVKYEYQITLFKITLLNIKPKEPEITSNDESITNSGWDISYSYEQAEGNYVWMATSLVVVKGTAKEYVDWKITLLYDNKGNYVGDGESSGKYEKKLFYRTSEYSPNLEAPKDNQNNVGWTETPTGVTQDYPYEYISYRWYNTETNQPLEDSTWTKPVLWSRWGSVGRDSANVEYIYCALSDKIEEGYWDLVMGEETNPKYWITYEGYQNDEFIYPLYDLDHNELWFDNPVGLTNEKPFLYVSIRKKVYDDVTDSFIWGQYSDPSLWSSLGKDGSSSTTETLGLMGPIVRFRGEWKNSETYYNMKNALFSDPDSLRYIDVVKFLEGFYMVKPADDNDSDGIRTVSGPYTDPISNTNDWKASDYSEFIATEVLVSENAKIDYLASNEVIILDKDPEELSDVHIVAGMTGGNSTIIDLEHSILGEGNNNVRIWAGTTTDYNENNESLTINLLEAPFRVYNDGTMVANKAKIEGDIVAKTISLYGDHMFWYNQDTITLPEFNLSSHSLAYILLYNNGNYCTVLVPKNNYKILYSETNQSLDKVFKESSTLRLLDNNLYTLISNCDTSDSLNPKYQWIVTLTGIYNIQVTNTPEEYVKVISFNEDSQENTASLDPDKFNVLNTLMDNTEVQVQDILTRIITCSFNFELGSNLRNKYSNSSKIDTFELKMRVPKYIEGNQEELKYTIFTGNLPNLSASSPYFTLIDTEEDDVSDPNFKYVSIIFTENQGLYAYLLDNNTTYNLNLKVTKEDDPTRPISSNLISDLYYMITFHENGKVKIII